MANAAEMQEYAPVVLGAGSATATLAGRRLGRARERSDADALAPGAALSRRTVGVLAASADLLVILCASVAAEVGYNFLTYGWLALNAASFRLCLFVALVYLATHIARRNYSAARYLDSCGHAGQTATHWNLAFMLAAFVGFLERSDASASRGAFIAFYFVGLGALCVTDALFVRFVRNCVRAGRLQATRIMIVGYGPELERLARRGLDGSGKQIVETCSLGDDPDALDRELAAAARSARKKSLDEVLIVAPLARADVIERCVRAFVQLPVIVDVHLESGGGLARFAGAHVAFKGGAASLRLPGRSVSSGDLALKRGFDMVFAALALALALPLMLAVALAIKFESAGPVFFTQIRYGYNKQPFRIFKFRTMTATQSSRRVQQAARNDFRVTRMGRFIRRFNIDELPQLANVLRGEMSLVGPRPHAVAHDRQFARSVEVYARRHNIKPGITGWAQVNGLRGPTDTSDKIERRVKFDLHYIDHWTLGLDVWILVKTLFSRTAYRNAF